jgi:hypothetical protein
VVASRKRVNCVDDVVSFEVKCFTGVEYVKYGNKVTLGGYKGM